MSEEAENNEIKLKTVGERLKDERQLQDFDLNKIAEKTRIPKRHILSLEASDFSALPGITYIVGFVKAYARALNLDEVQFASDIREELNEQNIVSRASQMEHYEQVDSATIPPKWLAWSAIGIAAVLLAAFLIWRTAQMDVINYPAEQASNEAPANAPKQKQAVATAPTAEGPVVFTAKGEIWLRIYEKEGERIFEKQMNAGESFTIPATAKEPLLLTGRPDLLTVTIGGKEVAPLGTAERTVSDLPISAKALLARPSEEESAAAVPATAAPTATPPATPAQ
ncbi:hypothetical protein LPB140_05945 [Sphingorhabdus lutea]|uniref:Cytoskeleton protein RodZ-like C-terminal domain-containing protein n=1 Tax=Sphingorhabdus lutea TaxID=1913578 RepID=A0A1L3JBH8_9SPHN|nr:RodZ domain-containing protein [Sphingorhabdus lutea]APG62413.1 hypothetical protein LPB140_05945 [Sphingorhabdus lutea]